MSDYTPTTQQVEDGFAHEPEYEYSNPIGYGAHVQSNRRAFRRWLAEVERSAAERALTEAADDLERANASPNLIELESRYAGFYSGIRSTTASNVEKLRRRAAAYRQEETE